MKSNNNLFSKNQKQIKSALGEGAGPGCGASDPFDFAGI